MSALPRASRVKLFETPEDVEEFFQSCASLEGPEKEPDWDEHLEVINESRGKGCCGNVIFVDTNVFMYAVGRAHALRKNAQEFFVEANRRNTPLWHLSRGHAGASPCIPAHRKAATLWKMRHWG